MSLKELVSKYVASSEHVFGAMEIVEGCTYLTVDSVRRVVESARAYLQDAKYYMEKKRFEVSLASIAYCEGLLDALKMLGAVKFEWPTRKEEWRGKER
jgi:FAD synthetase